MFSESIQRLARDGYYKAKLRKIMIIDHKTLKILLVAVFLFCEKHQMFTEFLLK